MSRPKSTTVFWVRNRNCIDISHGDINRPLLCKNVVYSVAQNNFDNLLSSPPGNDRSQMLSIRREREISLKDKQNIARSAVS